MIIHMLNKYMIIKQFYSVHMDNTMYKSNLHT